MLSKPIPAWILVGGFLLTAIAGSINAVGFMGIHHQALSHMSGTATILSTDLSAGRLDAAVHAGMVLISFFLGCVLSGMIIRRSLLQMGPRYGVALGVESLLLFGAALLLGRDSNYGDYLAAMACGLQNAMATTYSGAVIRTTHVTGIVTDLGLACGHWLRGEPVMPRQVAIHLTLITGFIGGGIIGAFGYQLWGVNALLFPATITGLTGIGYALYRQISTRDTTPAR
jgi:uncharacterized membrane protein YoaK (UPF0700 family)